MTQGEPHIGYKRASKGRIVVLEIRGQNNEDREGIVNKRFAKMRCSEALVKRIYDIRDEWIEYDKARSCHDYDFVYRVGQIITPDSYDENPNKVCANGIHYFLSEHAARNFFSKRTRLKKSEYFVTYHNNGRMREECTLGARAHRSYKKWDAKGMLVTWSRCPLTKRL